MSIRRHAPPRIAIANEVFDARDPTPEEALTRFRTLTGWAGAIQRCGADVLVCQRFHRDARINREGVNYVFVNDHQPARPSDWFTGSVAMRGAIASFRPDVVHVNGFSYPRALRRLRAFLLPATAVVVQDHGGFEPHRLSWFRRAWLRRGLKAADALLVSTAPQAAIFRDSGLVPAAVKIRDVMEGSTDLTLAWRPGCNGPLSVLWVGRLNTNKDPLTVLDGFAQFARTRADATLTFVYGTAELEFHLRDAIERDESLRAHVKLVGAVPHQQIGGFYAAADLFVLGSHREGSGYAALEAMACGVVPVLTNIPSFRGLTGDGRIGELWEVGSPQSLAAALSRAASGSLEAKRQACRSRFDSCFSWDAIGARALEIYRECSGR